jgi:hypothetical protein
MATTTLGTAATTTLTALSFGGALAPADIASMANGVLDDQINIHPIWPQAFAQTGLLYVPNRGVLKVLPGDYVAFDATTGWPILVSKNAAAGASWVHP